MKYYITLAELHELLPELLYDCRLWDNVPPRILKEFNIETFIPATGGLLALTERKLVFNSERDKFLFLLKANDMN